LHNIFAKSCAREYDHWILLTVSNRDLDQHTSFSLASLGRPSGIGEGQAHALEPIVNFDNASAGTSPVMAGLNHLPHSLAADGVQGRKRNMTIAGIDSSPGSMEDMDDHDAREEKRRQPVKRACNECRQQKVRRRATGLIRSSLANFSDCDSSDATSFKTLGPIVHDAVD
jgi:hypothetical protein